MEHLLSPALVALLQVILIDLVLAGDNAVVIGMAAARVPKEHRGRVIFWGLAAAVGLRIGLAMITATLLDVIGLMFAGGILLLWVSWRMYRDIHEAKLEAAGEEIVETTAPDPRDPTPNYDPPEETRSIRNAIVQIIVADISMSLDNVLAVAGAAMEHVWVLAVGLVLSIALMGVAATMVAKLLHKYPWISYAGLVIIVYVAARMIWDGWWAIMHATA